MFGNFLGGPLDHPDPFNGERIGYCAGCGCLADLNDHACPEIVRIPVQTADEIQGDERLSKLAGENTSRVTSDPNPEPTPRQLARAWTDFLASVGAVEVLDLGEWQ